MGFLYLATIRYWPIADCLPDNRVPSSAGLFVCNVYYKLILKSLYILEFTMD
jgi:hypothetical protein